MTRSVAFFIDWHFATTAPYAIQAMSDFAAMFPTLSSATIETVLRKNRGAVDDTIDDLLVLTMDGIDASDVPSATPVIKAGDRPPPYEAAIASTIPALAPDDPFNLGVLDNRLQSTVESSHAHANRGFEPQRSTASESLC